MATSLLKLEIDKSYPVITHGKGIFLYDTDGREYMDGSSGAMTANIGHGVREIGEAMHGQSDKVAFTFRHQFTNQPAERLATRIAALAPGDLNSVAFVNSGSEASEYAIRIALQHWRELGQSTKVKVLSRHTSYHGMTMGALSMSGQPIRRSDYGPLLHPFPTVPPAYCYRCPWGMRPESCARECTSAWDDALINAGVDTVAAVIVEPIVGSAGGVLMPPSGYLTTLREICDKRGVLLIVDEVITGLGRTGAWFACADEGIVPDMVLIGKGTSAGYSPMAGVILREHVVQALQSGSGNSPIGHTFSANPLSAAVCLAVLDYIEHHDLLRNARDRGRELAEGLQALAARHSHVADVRGRGLLFGFEFVLDKVSRAPPPTALNASAAFVKLCLMEGLVVYPAGIPPLNNAIIICPPLVISGAEVTELLHRLDRALAKMERLIDDSRGLGPADRQLVSAEILA
jgi:adenosylmethionine-8-amino-7-oxononanoate aminotransferase